MTISPALDERFRAAAAAAGLLDVAFDVVDGHADRAAARRRDRSRRLPDQLRCRAGAPPRTCSRGASARACCGPRSRSTAVRRELDEYFAGKRRHFDLEPDVRFLTDYNRVVLEELARVEYGTTTTYGSLAARTGNPRAARAVGTVMNRNPIPIVLPCHRVVGASGSLTGYAGGLERKELLLRLEGVLG